MTLNQFDSLVADLQRGHRRNKARRTRLAIRVQAVLDQAEHQRYDPTLQLMPLEAQEGLLSDERAAFESAIGNVRLMRLHMHGV